MSAAELLAAGFGSFTDLIAAHAAENGDRAALICGDQKLDYAELDRAVDSVAAALQRDGLRTGDIAAICVSRLSIDAVVAFLAIVRAGGGVAPLPAWLAPRDLAGMLVDCSAVVAFADQGSAETLRSSSAGTRVITLGPEADAWRREVDAPPASVPPRPDQTFNIIYSSGTTGRPKGIVLSHASRWVQQSALGYTADSVALVSLSLYSNMALISLLPALANGATVVLMPKFDAEQFLELSERWRVTQAQMVPVQVRRVLDSPTFDLRDLGSYRLKLVGGAPFPAEMLAEVLRRWPGGLVQTYGLTEGGGACALVAHLHPDKLHTVGLPVPGHEILVIDDAGNPLSVGQVGEVVGRSTIMLSSYLNLPDATREIQWTAPDGRVFLRSGDLGRFDEDGFLELVGRKKDMIISGGFNIYPSDIEGVLAGHPDVRECSVVGVPSDRWGESPAAFVVLAHGSATEPPDLLEWCNARLGKNQRLADLRIVDALPRNDNGKVVKRDLQQAYAATPTP